MFTCVVGIITFTQALLTCAAPYWGKLEKSGCAADRCGLGLYNARIWDAGNDWEGACKNTPLSYNGQTYKSLECFPTRVGPVVTAEYGRFELPTKDCGYWGNLKADKCTKPGHRQFSGILYNVPSGWKWEDCCAKIEISPKDGINPRKPDRCHNAVTNEWGEFDLPDPSCKPDDVCHWKKTDETGKVHDELKKKREAVSERFKRQPGSNKPNGNTGFYRFASDLICTAAIAAVNTLNQNTDPVREYRQGHNDRMEYLYAVVYGHHLDTGSAPSDAMRDFTHAMGRSNDDAGHIIANRLGGSGRRRYNIFPQSLNINRGVWAQTEATAANFLQRNPNGNVQIYFTFDYDSNTSTRPTRFIYRYVFSDGSEQTGEIINP